MKTRGWGREPDTGDIHEVITNVNTTGTLHEQNKPKANNSRVSHQQYNLLVVFNKITNDIQTLNQNTRPYLQTNSQ